MESFSRPELIDFHGVSMTEIFTSDWGNIQNFKARPDDILIATYPKAGGLHNFVFCGYFERMCEKKELLWQ